MTGKAERLLSVQVQKTAGTSFRTLFDDVYGAQNVYPRIEQSAFEDPAVALDRYPSIHCALNDAYRESYSADTSGARGQHQSGTPQDLRLFPGPDRGRQSPRHGPVRTRSVRSTT